MYYALTKEKLRPEHVARCPNVNSVFDLPTHAVNANVSEVREYSREVNETRGMTERRKWMGFTRKDIRQDETAAQAVKREINEGWPEGCKLINYAREQVLNVALNAPASRRLKMEHGHVQGFNPHVPTIMQGQPTAYSKWGRKPKVQAVKLLCELVADASKDASDLVWRGAAALVMADLLQEAGYAVEIWATNTVASGRSDIVTCTAALVKGADQAPIPDMLASVLVSPRFYRGAMLPSPRVFPLEIPSGYGTCRALNPAHLEGTDLEDLMAGIYIGGCFSIEAAVKEINKVVSEVNGTA